MTMHFGLAAKTASLNVVEIGKTTKLRGARSILIVRMLTVRYFLPLYAVLKIVLSANYSALFLATPRFKFHGGLSEEHASRFDPYPISNIFLL